MKRWLCGSTATAVWLAAAVAGAQGPGGGERGAEGPGAQMGRGPGPGMMGHEQGGRGGMGGGARVGHIEERVLMWLVNDPEATEQIGLKEDQKQALQKILVDSRKETIGLRAKMDLAAVDQAQLMSQDNPDEAALMKAIEDTGKWRTEIAKQEMKGLLAAQKILTAEQKTKLRDMFRDRLRERRAEGGGMRGGGMSGPHGGQRGPNPPVAPGNAEGRGQQVPPPAPPPQ